LQGVDQPVRIGKCGRIVLHIFLAGRRLGTADCVRAPDLPGPLAAEGDVKDDLLIFEVLVNVAAAGQLGDWDAPILRVGRTAADVGGNRAARKEPDADGFACPFRCVDTATSGVEAGTVSLGIAGCDGAADVGTLAWGIDIAVRC
jgi:hypothetical protein